MFWKTLESSSAILYGYDTITLRAYINIANTSNLSLLIISGRPNETELLEAWEKIIRRNEKETGSYEFSAYFQLLKGYALLINDHTLIRACLIICAIKPLEWRYVKMLSDKGYKIDPDNVMESITAMLQRCDNLMTKAVMKKNEIERIIGSKKEGTSFSDIIVNLNMNIGFKENENITLSNYNAYNKSLKARNKQQEDGSGNRKR